MAARVFAFLSALLFALLVSPVLTDANRQAVKYDPRRSAEMHERLGKALVVQAAVSRGDLEAARRDARVLAALETPTGLPDIAGIHMKALTGAAARAANAATVVVAATASAEMLASCGACHRAFGTMPALAARETPKVGGTVGHMLDHQRATDQLLRGLVVPSNEAWLQGARALRASPLHADGPPRNPRLAPELLRVEEAVHRLAEDAVAAEHVDSRVRVYSTLLSRCADCHSLHRKVWGPSR
jgi:hypothetical protein